MLNDGHAVAAIDGLKIEPLDPTLSGITVTGERTPFAPIRDAASLAEPLDDRRMAGFGGVAEYGITVRWDKNFLKLIRLLLERRARFALYGGVRFGGTLDVEDAFALGFDHVAVAAGAGKPTVLELPNGLANGVRTASDFLMALQLTGAAKKDSLANMQVRLPVIVVGGGLTAIDTATESLAYYPVQVEKFLARYEALAAERGRDATEAAWSADERAVAHEFLAHARALRAERAAAAAEQRTPRVIELLQSWGGATIAYRRRLIDSPAYTLNHEEVEKALEEGIRFAEGLTPLAVEVDAEGRVCGLTVSEQHNDGDGVWHEYAQVTLPARTLLIAAGTQPNTVLAREDAAHFHLAGKYFRLLDEAGHEVTPVKGLAKPAVPAVLTEIRADGRATSFFGDLHPSYAGNVVKAMASATQGAPIVSRMLAKVAPASPLGEREFFATLDREFRATVVRVDRLTPTIVEVVVHAPAAARRFRPGQFYRLQNFEALARRAAGTTLAMEGLALTGAWVDKERGLVSTIVLEMGGSSDLCKELRPGERVILMGPTGSPTEIASGETVVLAGGGLGNAVLFSIAQAFRGAGSKVLYFAGYKKRIDRYKVADIEAAADAVVWCCDEAPGFAPTRPQDRAFVGNIVAGDAGLRERCAGAAAGRLRRVRSSDRDRLGPDDGGGRRRAPRGSGALPQARAPCARVDQFADAVHDEGDLRAMPAAAPRSRDGQAFVCLLVFQPGPADRPRRFPGPRRAPRAECRAGEADRAMDWPLPRRNLMGSSPIAVDGDSRSCGELRMLGGLRLPEPISGKTAVTKFRSAGVACRRRPLHGACDVPRRRAGCQGDGQGLADVFCRRCEDRSQRTPTCRRFRCCRPRASSTAR